MKTIAIANLKGGVGKSTTTLFLAEHWALKKKRILVIDLDPQANVSFMLLSRRGVERCEKADRTLPHLFLHEQQGARQPAMSYIEQRCSDLTELKAPAPGFVALLPAVPRLWFEEYDFDRSRYRANEEPVEARSKIFRRLLAELDGHYDCVLFDCPPGFSTLTRSALVMSDKIISPTIADHVSVRSLGDFVDVGLEGIFGPLAQSKLLVVVSKFTGTNDQKDELDRLRKKYLVVGSPIPMRDQVVKATRCEDGSPRSYTQKYERPVYNKIAPHVRGMSDSLYKIIFES